MRVGIDLTCWSDPRGYGRFTRGLVRALLAAARHRYVLFVDTQTGAGDGPVAEPVPSGGRIVVMPTRRSPAAAASAHGRRSLRDLAAMARCVAAEPLDVLFYPSVYSYFPARTEAAVVVGVHDVIAEDYPRVIFPSAWRRLLWSAKSRLARRRADYLLTVSEHAKRGLLRRFRHPEERIWVVGEAADPSFRPLPGGLEPWPLDADGPRPGEAFLVYLGGINPHKNLVLLAESLAELRRHEALAELRLVIVGEIERERFTPGLAELRRAISRLGLGSAVVFAGYLDDAAVCRLLNAARALVLPSLAEGFGLPAVEAAACGTPVVATRNSPLPELLEGGGLFVDPGSRRELTGALERLLLDEALRRRLAATALERARRLSWERSAGQFHELLAAIAGAAR